MTHTRTPRGFTLIELIVVILILGILAAVAVIGYTQVTDRAQRNAAAAELRSLNMATLAAATLEGDGTATRAMFTEAIARAHGPVTEGVRADGRYLGSSAQVPTTAGDFAVGFVGPDGHINDTAGQHAVLIVRGGDGNLWAQSVNPSETEALSPVVKLEPSAEGDEPATPAQTLTSGALKVPSALPLIETPPPSPPSPPVTPVLTYSLSAFSTGQVNEQLVANVTGVSAGATFTAAGTLPTGVTFDSSTASLTGPATWGLSVVAQDSGLDHTVVLASDGKLYAWGDNSNGQLGDGTTTRRNTPVAVDMSGALAGKTVTSVTAGDYHTVVGTGDGRVYAWGYNSVGQLGDGTTITRKAPVEVAMTGALFGKTITSVTAGKEYTVAVTSDGRAYAWGYNDRGQLGDGTATSRTTPVAVTTSGALSGKTVTRVAAGQKHTVAVTDDGHVYAWGYNVHGQLGDGTTASRRTPVAVDTSGVLAGKAVTSVSAGLYHTVVGTSDGGVYAWGWNGSGQLGDGTDTSRSAPVAVDMSGVLAGKVVTSVAAGGFAHTVVGTSDGGVYAWGYNNEGQLGDGTPASRRLTPGTVDMSGVLAGKAVTSVSVGENHTVVGSSDGGAYAWGDNLLGQLGDGTATNRSAPVAIGTFAGVSGWPFTLTITIHDGARITVTDPQRFTLK